METITELKRLIDRLEAGESLTEDEWVSLIEGRSPELADYLFEKARCIREREYGKAVYVRGLIECSNYCKNDCLYCGIRRSNRNASRYRLSREEILSCCENGYQLGFRTFVLQGGEDPAMTDDWVMEMVQAIRAGFPDCAITLSLGEKKYDTLKCWKEAGVDRYLLRHETADACHYASLHPAEMSFEHRMQCLRDLKALGYQTGCGFMVGSPHQTARCLARDMRFIEELDPEMVGIGPFIPQHDTPFGGEAAGTLEETLFLLGLLRLLKPEVLLPATTALGTIHPMGRELGILAGGNVVMPNLSPVGVRAKYMLYDNKICTGDEAAECINCMKRRMESIGYEVVIDRGDYKG
ncbi:[FeFe] hydrogenase H-cluster radical SAM maturase HydE [Clostridium sp.]|uniref:[FeFe] hydrogenase H-cluster radical SAM maturase HydE n=1 Tax=Clostridium sp. TaxID=1506 RepID=UPI003520A0FF